MTKTIRIILVALIFAVGAETPAWTAEYFVSPTASSSGNGSSSSPFSLKTVLTGGVAKPGDTFWLRGGYYSLGYCPSSISGVAGSPITLRAVPGQRVTVDGSTTLFGTAGYLTFWGIEWMTSDPNRFSTQTGFYPTDINKRNGFNTFTPYTRFINMVVHDQVGAGIYFSPETVGSEANGCVMYNNGYATKDLADGHAFYVKNNGATKTLMDNIALNDFAVCFHIYTDGTDKLNNIVMDGNVAFNGGIYSPNRSYRTFLIGADGGTAVVNNITLQNTWLYWAPNSPATCLGQAQVGRDGANGTLYLRNNVFPAGLQFKNWASGTASGNAIGGSGTLVDYYRNLVGQGLGWDYSTYRSFNSSATPFRCTESTVQSLSFPGWESLNGFDAHGTLANGGFSGTQVIVRPNKYEKGRANLIIYNWAHASTVTVDASSVLTPGMSYEVHNAQDYYHAPLLSGIYQGENLVLPMSGLTVAKPNGVSTAAPSVGPEFGVFVLVALPSGTPDSLTTSAGKAVTVSASTLLANDTGLRAPLTLTGVSSTSARGGVVNLASGTVTYTPASGFSGSDTFTYSITDALGSSGKGLVTVTVAASAPQIAQSGTFAYANPTALTIPLQGPASVYPSKIQVSGLAGALSNAKVTVTGLTHTSLADVTMLLVSPAGQVVRLMSYIGLHAGATNLTLSFDRNATATLPASGAVVSGTYQPTVYGPMTSLPAPAPVAPYGNNLGSLVGTSPNGTWSLYVADMYATDGGKLAGAWSITLTTVNGTADVAAGAQTALATPRLAFSGEAGVMLQLPWACRVEASADGHNWHELAGQASGLYQPSAAASAGLYRLTSPDQTSLVMGFARRRVPARGFALITCPFVEAQTLAPVPGEVALAGAPEGASVFAFNGTSFQEVAFRGGQWEQPLPALAPGRTVFVRNPSDSPWEILLSGRVMPSAPLSIAAGYNLVAAPEAAAGHLEKDLGMPATPGTKVYLYRSGNYQSYTRGEVDWQEQAAGPVVGLGEGFFLVAPSATLWQPPMQ